MSTSTPMIVRPRGQSPQHASRYTARDWDAVRRSFSSSILVDTPLSSLAQNLEGLDWPLPGRAETPAAYLYLSFDEMKAQLVLRGQPPRAADHLIEILRETLAFDDPFGDMIAQGGETEARENPLVKNLARLGIPGDFPVALVGLSPETLLFCRLEDIKTLGEFALMAQRMSGQVIVGGDFRALLNALSNIDEATLARYLPTRPGAKGVHYLEGLALAVGSQPVEMQAALSRRSGQPLSAAAAELADTVSSQQMTEALEALRGHAAALRPYCRDEYDELERKLASGVPAAQLVSVLDDPMLEAVVAVLIKPPPVQRPSLFERFLVWWRD